MMTYYSQQGEDFLLARFFGQKPTGFFIDVGAFDGVYLSNSYCFEQLGWSGICVEASPRYFELCKKNRPKSRCVQAACGNEEGGIIDFRDEQGGLFSGVHTDESYASHCYAAGRIPFRGFETIKVPSTTLNKLLEGHTGDIDFVSIDVEGSEEEVLEGFDLDRYRPRLMVLEANTEPEAEALDRYAQSRGYRLARVMNWNRFYVRTEADRQALRAVTIAAKLEAPPHPLGLGFAKFCYPPSGFVYWPAEAPA